MVVFWIFKITIKFIKKIFSVFLFNFGYFFVDLVLFQENWLRSFLLSYEKKVSEVRTDKLKLALVFSGVTL